MDFGIPQKYASLAPVLAHMATKKAKVSFTVLSDGDVFTLTPKDGETTQASIAEVLEALKTVPALKKRFPTAKQADDNLAIQAALDIILGVADVELSPQAIQTALTPAADFLANRYFVCSSSTAFVIDAFLLVALMHLIPQAINRFLIAPAARYVDFVQHSLKAEGAPIDIVPLERFLDHPISVPKLPAPRAAGPQKGEKKQAQKGDKKQKAQTENEKGGKKKQKKQQQKPKQAPAPARPLDVGDANLIVGKIISVRPHPDAEKLYVEEIDCGEEKPRTICSGLRPFLQESDLQDKLVIIAANLKPVKMRGIVSAGMVMCASNDDHSAVELLAVPENAKVGERVVVEGFENREIRELRPKKKEWEQLAPHFVLRDGVMTWKDKECRVGNSVIRACTMSVGTVG